jgi:phenylpropionate dioxygenase-like ring-hydroxylating dioxygenase large terminal subunit
MKRIARSAYGFSPGAPDWDMVAVGRGTPGGELLRRYWHPVALADEATSLPRLIRYLGEDLLLFRDGNGEVGLFYPRCAHRGTSLMFGRVETDGIRCCYHGWKYETGSGRCLEQPCEPEPGRLRDRIAQPGYPVVERYGAVWAYMGPDELRPDFPRFSIFEKLGPDDAAIAFYISMTGTDASLPVGYNYFQLYENFVDPLHVPILHFMISGPQFGETWGGNEEDWASELKWTETPHSMVRHTRFIAADGEPRERVTETVLPCMAFMPSLIAPNGPATEITWIQPIDDTHHRVLILQRAKKGAPPPRMDDFHRYGPERKTWPELTAEEHQRYPGDHDAQYGQGAATLHSEEHLAVSDIGVVRLRRRFREQCAIVREGGRPAGLAFEDGIFPVGSGVFPVPI